MEWTASDMYRWTSHILKAARAELVAEGFEEMLPALLSERYEPGARHSIAVMGHRALPKVELYEPHTDPNQRVAVRGHRAFHLPVSHCVEKQLALEYLDKVYCLAPCVRLLMENEHGSGRHLYTFFQIEIEWRVESVEEVFRLGETLLRRIGERLLEGLPEAWLEHGHVRKHIESITRVPYPRVLYEEAQATLRGHNAARREDELSSDEEVELAERFGTPYWLFEFPEGIRDSIYRRNASGRYDTYDLVLPFAWGELTTGGIRAPSRDEIIRQSQMLGKQYHPFYADWKHRTGVQTGGFGIGLERLVGFCSDAPSILNVRFPHDQGPNGLIEREAAGHASSTHEEESAADSG